jgi:hypothetical protein
LSLVGEGLNATRRVKRNSALLDNSPVAVARSSGNTAVRCVFSLHFDLDDVSVDALPLPAPLQREG